jgi:putative redox protein
LSSGAEVTVTWAGEQRFIGSDGVGHSVVFDSSAEGAGIGIGPMKALLASLGACSGMDVVAILRKRKQRVTSLRVELRGTRPTSGYPKPYKEIAVTYIIGGSGLERKYVDEAVNDSMRKYCSVAATVSGKAKITYEYTIAEEKD